MIQRSRSRSKNLVRNTCRILSPTFYRNNHCRTMGQTASSTSSPASQPPASCPMHQKPAPPAACPIKHDEAPAKCPIDHGGQPLSQLNQMPDLAQAPAPNQKIALPLSRTQSSIPRDPAAKWEYPSPQQFYNALVRKGWETPEEHVETMVEIHNFLNEEAWNEVLKWEKRSTPYVFPPILLQLNFTDTDHSQW